MNEAQYLDLIAECSGTERDALAMDQSLVEQARFNSLTVLLFMALLESRYGVRLNAPRDARLDRLSVGDLWRIVKDSQAEADEGRR